MSLPQVIERIVDREGGTANIPQDHGGLTRWGITRPWLMDRLGRDVSDADILGLSRDQAVSLYTGWAIQFRLDKLPDALMDIVIDWAVQTTPRSAVRLLQEAVGMRGADVDGLIGPATLSAITSAQGGAGEVTPDGYVATVRRIAKARIKHRAAVVHHEPSQAVFLEGWINRDLEFL